FCFFLILSSSTILEGIRHDNCSSFRTIFFSFFNFLPIDPPSSISNLCYQLFSFASISGTIIKLNPKNMSFFSRLFSGDKNPLDRYSAQIAQVNGFKDEAAALSQEQIQKEISDFKSEV